MTPKPSLRAFLALSGSALLLVSQSNAANYYWDSNGNTAGLGDTSGTWGTTLAWGSMNAGSSRIIIAGTQATANTSIAVGDTVYFGTVNLSLGSTASTIGIVGTNVQANQIVFGAGQGAQGVTLSGGGGAITLSNANAGIVANNTGNNTIGAILNGTAGLIKGGAGNVILTGANGFTGGVAVTGGGNLQVGNGTSGSLTSQNLTFRAGGGGFNARAADAGSTQAMGTLTFTNTGATAGEGTVQSTYGSSGNAELSFTSLAARQGGATGNFVVSGGTNGSTNKIVLTGAATGFLDTGLYFGGSTYAAYDAGGFVRGLIYGTDTDAETSNTITASKHVQLTSSPAARPGDTLLSLHLAGGGVNYTMDSGTLTVPAILKSGGGAASTISGGDSLTTASNAEPVIRTDTSSDSLTISTAITGTSGGLTKTGKGTLTLSGTNGYSGVTRILDGTLILSGGSAIADTEQVLLANAPGTTLQLNSNETILNLYGGGFSGGAVDVQGNTLTLAGGATVTFGGTYTGTGSGGIVKQGTNQLTLTNKNTFAGTFTIEGGAVEFQYGNDGTGTLIPLSSGGAFNMANGTTLRFNAAANLPAGVFGAQLQSANGGSPAYPYGWTFANNINITDGTASIRVGGNENSVRFTGTISGGPSGSQTLAIYPGGIATGNGDRQPNVYSGTIQNGGGGILGVNIDFAGASGTAQNVFASLSGQNTFTGPINVTNSKGLVAPNAGYVGIGGEIYSTGSSNVTFVTGSGYLGGGNYANTIALATGTILTYLSSADQTLGGEISGGGALLKRGSGALTLSTNNTYTGTTTINSGVLIANSANAIPGGLAFDSTGSAININGSGAILGLGSGDFTRLPSGVTVTAGKVAFADNGGFAAYGADRTVNFGGSNGIVAIGSTTTAVIGDLNGKILHLGATSATHKITVTNTLDFGSATRTIQVNNGAAAVDAEISGVLQAQAGNTTAGLTKTGDGTLVLSNTNAYAGGTTVSAGTLTVNGSLADATMSINGATVNGSGTLNFNVSGATIDQTLVSTGGTLNAAGLTVNINGTLTEPEYVLVAATGGGSISGTFAGLTNGQGYTLNYATANQVKLVAPGGVTFASWRTANNAGAQTLSDDHDNDGVDNGTEFFLGGDTNTTGFTVLPPVLNTGGTLSVTWTKHPNYTGAYNTDFVVETSDTLGSWTSEPTPPSTVTTSGNNVTYTFPGGPAYTGRKFARLKVTGPN